MVRLIILLLSLWATTSEGFYHSGVNPQSFAAGDVVKLKVNKLTSVKTQMPLDYYILPFCSPEGGPKMDNANFGELLAGDRIKSSPYYLEMKKDMYCEQLCVSNLGRAEMANLQPNKMVKAIRKNYHNNWIVDNLPSASKVEDDEVEVTRYWQGFPIGFISEETKEACIHNHVNIEITFHTVETEANKHRVVRFMVEPFSIAHDFESLEDSETEILEGDHFLSSVAKLKDPIESCRAKSKTHTNYDMVTGPGRKSQLASGNVLFTYDVIWVENMELKWADRWDVYLNMDGKIPAKVHSLSIFYSFVIVIVLCAMIVAIMVHNLRRGVHRYDEVAPDEDEPVQVLGWKLFHVIEHSNQDLTLVEGSIFGPPRVLPWLFCVCCGTGAHLLSTATLAILMIAAGIVTPAERGHLAMALFYSYLGTGAVNGYITAGICKSLYGKDWKTVALSASAYPGITFVGHLLLDLIASTMQSSLAVPARLTLILLLLYICVCIPLIYAGAYVGYDQGSILLPPSTTTIHLYIPKLRQSSICVNLCVASGFWALWNIFSINGDLQNLLAAVSVWLGYMYSPALGFMVAAGLLEFSTAFVETYYIFAALWLEFWYYVPLYLLLTVLILVLSVAAVSLLVTLLALGRSNFNIWWFSFQGAMSFTLWFFLYVIVYLYMQGFTSDFSALFLYTGFMLWISLSLFLMLSFVGFSVSVRCTCALFNYLADLRELQHEVHEGSQDISLQVLIPVI